MFAYRYKKTIFITFVHVETESKARASGGKPLVSHLIYASQVLRIRLHYLNPGNYRSFSLIQSSIITSMGSCSRLSEINVL